MKYTTYHEKKDNYFKGIIYVCMLLCMLGLAAIIFGSFSTNIVRKWWYRCTIYGLFLSVVIIVRQSLSSTINIYIYIYIYIYQYIYIIIIIGFVGPRTVIKSTRGTTTTSSILHLWYAYCHHQFEAINQDLHTKLDLVVEVVVVVVEKVSKSYMQ